MRSLSITCSCHVHVVRGDHEEDEHPSSPSILYVEIESEHPEKSAYPK